MAALTPPSLPSRKAEAVSCPGWNPIPWQPAKEESSKFVSSKIHTPVKTDQKLNPTQLNFSPQGERESGFGEVGPKLTVRTLYKEDGKWKGKKFPSQKGLQQQPGSCG